MKKKQILWVCVILITLFIPINATTLKATVFLPDGNPAPLATVLAGNREFTADKAGNVVLEVPGNIKTLVVRWLEIETELPVSETLKLNNRRLYSAPYHIDDFLVHGDDIWVISDNEIYAKAGFESQLFYEDVFDNTLTRTKFTLSDSEQWNYVRFFTRLYDPGFNGYNVSLPAIDDPYYARYEGNWDLYTDLPPTHFGYKFADNVEYEMVLLNEDERMALWIRETSKDQYQKMFDIVDDTAGAFYDGGFAIGSSFLSVVLTEFAVFEI